MLCINIPKAATPIKRPKYKIHVYNYVYNYIYTYIKNCRYYCVTGLCNLRIHISHSNNIWERRRLTGTASLQKKERKGKLL